MKVELEVSKPIIEFTSYTDYKKSVKMQYEQNNVRDERQIITIDAKGRICTNDFDYILAEKDGGYPIKSYWIDADKLSYKEPLRQIKC